MPKLYARKSKIIFSESGATVLAFNLDNGEKLATYAEGDGNVSAITVVEDMLIAGMTSGDLVSFKILNSRVCWKVRQDGEVIGVLVSQGNIISYSKNQVNFWNIYGIRFGVVSSQHEVLQCHIQDVNVFVLNNCPSIEMWSIVPDKKNEDKVKQITAYNKFLSEEGSPKCIIISGRSIFYSTSKSIMGELVVSDGELSFSRRFNCSPALDGHGDDKIVTCIDTTNSLIVAGYGNNVVQCWNRAGEEPALQWTQCHERCGEGEEGITSLKIDADADTVYSGAWDHFIRSWNLHTGEKQDFEHSHVWGIRNVIVYKDINRIISGGHDGKTRVWDIATNSQVWEASHKMIEVHAPHAFDEFIYVGSNGEEGFGIQQWSVKDSKCHQSAVLGNAMRAMDMAYSFEMSRIFVSTVNCTMFAVDKRSCKVVWSQRPYDNWVVRIFCVNSFIITFTNPNNVHCWDAATGDKCWNLNLPFLDVDMKSNPTANQFCVPTSEEIESQSELNPKSDNRMQSINVSDGEILWTIETVDKVTSMVSIVGENQFAGLSDGSIVVVDKDGRVVIKISSDHKSEINNIDPSINRIVSTRCHDDDGGRKCIVVTGSQ